MQRFVVVGLGHFGGWAARALYAAGHDVIAIERDAQLVDRFKTEVSAAVLGDATDRAVLDQVGARGADVAIVSTGEDLATSILATLALRDLGVKDIYVKVGSPEAARALEAFGVRETIFPEREVADRLAHRITSRTVLDYVPLAPGFSLQEVAIPDGWLGRTLRDLALPANHGIQVVALRDMLAGKIEVVPDPDRPLRDSDVAIVAGPDDAIRTMLVQVRSEG
ncbi:MAG: TrkA family potassium uptake protein [Gemmatimonadota bacterium]|nr:TrkA family potassium uptake protein [Gemmatimonadota bacterium]MDH5195879.1 TrkA family potassium uptake protein [Gemmatimonadota bacterium]